MLRGIRGIYRLLLITQPLGLLLATAALTLDYFSQEQARTVAAWQLLTTKASGNSGKVEALEYLNSPRWFGLFGPPRASLSGIDLSSPSGMPRTFLAGVDLSGASLGESLLDHIDASEADFSGANLLYVKLTNSYLWGANFADANLDGADFSGSALSMFGRFGTTTFGSINLSNAHIYNGSVEGSRLYANVDGAVFSNVNVSGAEIYYYPEPPKRSPRGWVWAKKGHPAIALPSTLSYFECDTNGIDVSPANGQFSAVKAKFIRASEVTGGMGHIIFSREYYDYQELDNGDIVFVPESEHCVEKVPPTNAKLPSPFPSTSGPTQ